MDELNGQVLDREIASKIMGWSVVEAGGEDWLEKAVENCATYPIWHWWPEGGTGLYRTDNLDHEVWSPAHCIVAAWEVVEEMRERGWRTRIEYFLPDLAPPFEIRMDRERQPLYQLMATGIYLPETICRAVLCAIEKEPGNGN